MRKIKARLDKGVNAFAIGIFVVLVFVTFLQVIGRYVFQNPPSWTEEMARYLSIWLVLMGVAIAFRTNSHLGIDFFVNQMPAGIQRIAIIGINGILCLIVLVIIWKGVSMTAFVSRQLSPAMRIPMSFPYGSIPVGGMLMLIEVVINFKKAVFNKGEA